MSEQFTVRTYGREHTTLAEVGDNQSYPFVDYVIKDELLTKMSDKIQNVGVEGCE